eukprot:COSAG01_NODE_6293_length_3751_cov_1.697700_7_plen_181_part_00
MFGHEDQVSTIQGVIMEDVSGELWKLLVGPVEMTGWEGVHYPNASTDTCCFSTIVQHASKGLPSNCPRDDPCPVGGVSNCSHGCLYKVKTDPYEYQDVAAQNPEMVSKLSHRLEELRETAFLPVRCTCDDGFGGVACTSGPKKHADGGPITSCDDARSCENAMGIWGGFWGPFVEIDGQL